MKNKGHMVGVNNHGRWVISTFENDYDGMMNLLDCLGLSVANVGSVCVWGSGLNEVGFIIIVLA